MADPLADWGIARMVLLEVRLLGSVASVMHEEDELSEYLEVAPGEGKRLIGRLTSSGDMQVLDYLCCLLLQLAQFLL
jgi:hypothetical protein